MAGPRWPTPWLLDVSDGQGQHCWKTNHREGQAGNFKRLFPGQMRLLFQLFLHLWTTAMKTMNKEQTQGQMGKSWHSWRVGPTGSHAGPSPADDKQVASTGESAARSGSAGHSGS